MHIIGRSKTTVAEQLMYVHERTEEMENSSIPIEFNGRIYTDSIRFNSCIRLCSH